MEDAAQLTLRTCLDRQEKYKPCPWFTKAKHTDNVIKKTSCLFWGRRRQPLPLNSACTQILKKRPHFRRPSKTFFGGIYTNDCCWWETTNWATVAFQSQWMIFWQHERWRQKVMETCSVWKPLLPLTLFTTELRQPVLKFFNLQRFAEIPLNATGTVKLLLPQYSAQTPSFSGHLWGEGG